MCECGLDKPELSGFNEPCASNGEAAFLFYWEGIPFFTVIENNRGFKNGSAVSAGNLIKVYGIIPPPYPTPKMWARETGNKKRCFRCYRSVKGIYDLRRHLDNVHSEKILRGESYVIANH